MLPALQWQDVPAEADLLLVQLFEQALAAGHVNGNLSVTWTHGTWGVELFEPGVGGEQSGPAGQAEPLAAAVHAHPSASAQRAVHAPIHTSAALPEPSSPVSHAKAALHPCRPDHAEPAACLAEAPQPAEPAEHAVCTWVHPQPAGRADVNPGTEPAETPLPAACWVQTPCCCFLAFCCSFFALVASARAFAASLSDSSCSPTATAAACLTGVCTRMSVHTALTPHFQKGWKGVWAQEGAGMQLLIQAVPGLVSHHCLSAADAERASMSLAG